MDYGHLFVTQSSCWTLIRTFCKEALAIRSRFVLVDYLSLVIYPISEKTRYVIIKSEYIQPR